MINDADALSTSEAKSIIPAFSAAALKHRLPYALVGRRDMKLPDSLDRLFSDQVALGSLTAQQSGDAYQAHFGRKAPASLAAIKGLSVEAFVQVSNVLRFHGETVTANDDSIVKKLERQAASREARARFIAPKTT